jgi:transcriptional regulator
METGEESRMTYPPDWRSADRAADIVALIRDYPFAYLMTTTGGLRSTRIPFMADCEDGRPVRLRAHLNAANPQAKIIDQGDLLIVFAGPSTYVSPNWRTDRQRAATFDYEEVQVRGTATLEPDRGFFIKLVDDLASQIEPQYADIGDYPVWQTAMAPDGYIDRLFPHVTSFSVAVSEVRMVSKLHQAFPEEDRASIAAHLSRSGRTDSREIAERIRRLDD